MPQGFRTFVSDGACKIFFHELDRNSLELGEKVKAASEILDTAALLSFSCFEKPPNFFHSFCRYLLFLLICKALSFVLKHQPKLSVAKALSITVIDFFLLPSTHLAIIIS